MLATSEKEWCSASGTGAAPPIVARLVGPAASSNGTTNAAWALAMCPVRCGLHLLPIIPGLVTGRGVAASSWYVTSAATERVEAGVGIDLRPRSAPLFGRTEGIGCVPMQKLLLLAETEALGVCPCEIYFTFGKTGGIGCVPMRNLLPFPELKAFGCVPMQNLLLRAKPEALGVCPCGIYYFSQN